MSVEFLILLFCPTSVFIGKDIVRCAGTLSPRKAGSPPPNRADEKPPPLKASTPTVETNPLNFLAKAHNLCSETQWVIIPHTFSLGKSIDTNHILA